MSALARLSARFVRGHPMQVLLLVVGVALGVAVAVAIDLANGSARRAFVAATETLGGRATHQVVAGPAGCDEALYRRLKLAGIEACAPVVEGYVDVGSRPMRLLGLDPFAEAVVGGNLTDDRRRVPVGDLGRFFTQPGAVLVSETLGIRPGARIVAGRTTLHVIGRLRPRDDISRVALAGVLLADVATAQEVLGMAGRLSRIDMRLDDVQAARVARLLPPGVRLARAAERTAALQGMTAAFELNLRAISLLALVVGTFLIYNTITFFVLRRRATLGILRALGATGGQVMRLVLGESLALAAVGTVLGLALGIVLAQGALALVTRTINDLYFTLGPTELHVSAAGLLKGAVLGLAAAAVAAALPAREAARVPPAGVMQRSEVERKARGATTRAGIAAAVLLALGAALLRLPGDRLDVAFAALVLVLVGGAAAVPPAMVVLMGMVAPWSGRLGGVAGRLAPRNIVRHASRTVVAVAALMLAVSSIVGVQIMVGSFRATFTDWLAATLSADVFVGAPSNTVSRSAGFDAAVAREVAAVPGVARVATARNVVLETPSYGVIHVAAVSADIAARRRFLWVDGDPRDLWRRMRNGQVLVSQPLAFRHHIPAASGQEVELPTDGGPRRFPVAAIFYDYGSELGAVIMADPIYRGAWRDRLVSTIAAFAAPDAPLDAVLDRVRARVAPRGLHAQSNRGLREAALAVFDRTFAITAALRVLVAVVAFIGILSSLMALQLERTREVGVLRACGLSVGQLWRLVLLETGLMAGTAGLLAMPVGTALALILVEVVNPRSFGWTLAFVPRPQYFVEAFALALAAGLLAAVYPAWRFTRLRVADAIRME